MRPSSLLYASSRSFVTSSFLLVPEREASRYLSTAAVASSSTWSSLALFTCRLAEASLSRSTSSRSAVTTGSPARSWRRRSSSACAASRTLSTEFPSSALIQRNSIVRRMRQTATQIAITAMATVAIASVPRRLEAPTLHMIPDCSSSRAGHFGNPNCPLGSRRWRTTSPPVVSSSARACGGDARAGCRRGRR